MSELKPAVGYCRFSSNMQREESIDAQKRAITNYANDNGFIITEWYCDEAKSGRTADRPEFQRMMDDVKNDKIQYLIVHKLDRFTRSVWDYAENKNMLEEHNCVFISVGERIDDTPSGKFMSNMIIAISEHYSNNLATEVMKGQRENAFKGLWTGGVAPLGYDVVDKRLVINEDEAKAVRLIYEMSADGYGYGQIIDRLNLLGYKTKRGQPFGKNSLHDLIRNEKYKGVYVFNLRSAKKGRNRKRNNHAYKREEEIIRIPGGCPAIVSEDLWNRANSTLRVTGKYKTNAKQPYLLSGLLVCGECGAKMHGNLRKTPSGNQYTTYRCNVKNNQRTCHSKEIHAAPLDKFVLDMVFKNYFTEERLPVIAEQVNRQMRENILNDETLVKAKEELQTKIHTRDILIKTIVKTGEIDAISQQIKQLADDIKKLQQFVSNAEKGTAAKITADDVRDFLQPLRERFQSAECNEQVKVILSQIIDRIVVYRDRADIYLKMQFENARESVKKESEEEKNIENVIPTFTPTYFQGISVSMTDVAKHKPDYKPLRDMSALLKGRTYEMPEFDAEAVRSRYTAS